LREYPKLLRPEPYSEEIGVVFPAARPVRSHLASLGANIKEYVRLIRPHQWVKNGFVLIPAFFAGKVGALFAGFRPWWAFLSFCAAASAVYILNDLFDLEKDRAHYKKRLRPLAAGTVPVRNAVLLLVALLGVSAGMAVSVGMSFLYVVIGYFALNFFYSIYFKHISLIDISFIAVGFVLRVLAGGIATDVTISKWLVLMTFLLACCLAVGKRRDDLLMSSDKTAVRPANTGYTLPFIDTCLIILGVTTIVCYIMYTVSEDVVRRLHSDNVYLTSVFVIIGILRFLQIAIVEQKSGAPTLILLRDTMIQAMIGLWFISFLIIIYAG
jgi:decaprenyl-phosphate phosphoribosyltransferase